MSITQQYPAIVDFRIAGTCNLRCEFCFGPRHHLRSAPLEAITACLENLAQGGVRRIVFTGGEPTLVKDFPLIIQKARKLFHEVVLSTNTKKLYDFRGEILPFLDWVAVPLESSIGSIHALARPGDPDNFRAVLDALKWIREEFPSVKIKLGTVITRINCATAPTIPRVIVDRPPDMWKIYELAKASYGADNYDKLAISSTLFEEVASQCVGEADKLGIITTVWRESARDGMYFFVEPDLRAMIVDNGREVLLGPLGVGHDVFSKIRAGVNPLRQLANYERTYP